MTTVTVGLDGTCLLYCEEGWRQAMGRHHFALRWRWNSARQKGRRARRCRRVSPILKIISFSSVDNRVMTLELHGAKTPIGNYSNNARRTTCPTDSMRPAGTLPIRSFGGECKPGRRVLALWST